MRPLLTLLLVACAESTTPLPPPLTLVHGPAVAGYPMSVTVMGANPSDRVHLGGARGIAPGPCPSILGGACLGIGPGPVRIGSGTADALGEVQFAPVVPASLSGFVALQAASTGSVVQLTTPTSTWVHPSGPAGARGAWFWRDTGHPHGAGTVVGDPVAELAELDAFDEHGVHRVYASYDWAAPDAESSIAAWHATLHPEREVQLLLGENTWIDPLVRPNLLAILTDRLVDFHAGRPAEERFDGVHLDIEPQALPEWSTSTPAQRRDLLLMLRDTFADVRAHLDANGAAQVPIYADLPVWFDNVPGSVGWLDAGDRDAWFADICSSLTGVSLMAFERDNLGSILNGTDWERNNLACEVRMGLQASTTTWGNALGYASMIAEVEAATGLPLDLQSWTQTVDLW